MTGKQWNGWNRSSSKSKGWDTRSAKPKGNPQSDKAALPAYDSTSLPSSLAGSSRAPDKSKDGDLKQALKELISQNDLEVPAALKTFIQQENQQDLGNSLKEDQRLLNYKRKLAQRIQRLKQAQQRKEEQWTKFKEDMRNHMVQEKERFETESKEISKALEETQTELDKALSGVQDIPKENEAEIVDVDLMEIFPEEENTKITGPKIDMEEMLKQSQAGQMMLAKQLGDLQAQMSYMAAMIQSPAVLSPSRPAMEEALIVPETPKGTSVKRNALEPFSRAARGDGPYTTPEKGQKIAENAKLNLNGLDGYGPA